MSGPEFLGELAQDGKGNAVLDRDVQVSAPFAGLENESPKAFDTASRSEHAPLTVDMRDHGGLSVETEAHHLVRPFVALTDPGPGEVSYVHQARKPLRARGRIGDVCEDPVGRAIDVDAFLNHFHVAHHCYVRPRRLVRSSLTGRYYWVRCRFVAARWRLAA
jgi:hypothetical protein